MKFPKKLSKKEMSIRCNEWELGGHPYVKKGTVVVVLKDAEKPYTKVVYTKVTVEGKTEWQRVPSRAIQDIKATLDTAWEKSHPLTDVWPILQAIPHELP